MQVCSPSNSARRHRRTQNDVFYPHRLLLNASTPSLRNLVMRKGGHRREARSEQSSAHHTVTLMMEMTILTPEAESANQPE